MLILILLLLFLFTVVLTIIFYILINPKEYKEKVSFKDSFKLICVAMALNKLLFTGSGYVISSYFSRNKNLAVHKSLSVFFLLEFLSIFLWLVSGVYFGAKIAVRVLVFFLIVIVIFIIAVCFKRKKFIFLVRNIIEYLKKVKSRIVWVIPFIILNMVLLSSYYFFLFKLFSFTPKVLDIIKIVSVSVAISYLSPAPAGLGFKETGLIFLLVEKGVAFNNAMTIAILDRGITTIFFAVMGIIMGFDLIKEEIGRRFKRNKRTRDSEVKKASES